ncbi:MAG TPA: MoxR family ATPase [Tissierellia bacterium]|nr:MoxR family ATPase [Tissierellia bacterium]
MQEYLAQFDALMKEIKQNIEKAIVGKSVIIEYLLIALAAGGHVLIEDVPGIGKTTLARALARSLDLSFNRIQFTPDIMPSDVSGFSLYNQKLADFEFQPGVVMTNLLLADEINRTSPKTQSALLEAMQENQVTVDGKTYKIPQPFMVLATQNPVEYLGTYPLPEAQLDRFLMKVRLGYPTIEEEIKILEVYGGDFSLEDLTPVVRREEVSWMRQLVKEVHAAPVIKHYVSEIAQATRQHQDVLLGMSPRASQMLLSAAKARALLHGRDFVRPDDVQALLHVVLSHRIILKPDSRLRRVSVSSVIRDIASQVPVRDQL